MKKTTFWLALLFGFALSVFAQSDGFHYKFLIFENGTALANSPVNIKFTIKDGSTVIWEEEHLSLMTDANGIASCYLGEGNKLSGTAATFNDIDWSADLTYNVDVNTGSGYTNLISGKPFKFVPKAKYAETADFNKLKNKPVTFYRNGTTDYPIDINDDIYHLGSVAVGDNMLLGDTKLYVLNNNTGIQHGIQVSVSAASGDNTAKYGIKSSVTGQGNGYLTGFYNSINSDGTGTHASIRNRIEGTGSGTHLGVHNFLRGSGGGFQVGEFTQIDNTGNNYHYGNYVELTGPGSGVHIGYAANLIGGATGSQYGAWTYLGVSGDGLQYGIYNEIAGSGNGEQYGTYNYIYNTGTGDKYGTYNKIDATTSGTHYGVYADVTKSGSYAGYFVGDVYMSQKLLSDHSGNADMKAYIYGNVDASGNIIANASSGGFSVNKTGTGEYTIHFVNPPAGANAYIVVGNVETPTGFGIMSVTRGANSFVVRTGSASGIAADFDFFFVVYKK